MPHSRLSIIPIRDSIRSGLKSLRRGSHLLDSAMHDTPPRYDLEDLRAMSARFHRLIDDAESIGAALLRVQDKASTTPTNSGGESRVVPIRPKAVRQEPLPQAPIVAKEVSWDLVKSQGRVCVTFVYRSLDGKIVRGICSPGMLSSAMRSVQKLIRSSCGRNETPTHFTLRRSGVSDVPRDQALAFIDAQIERSTWKQKFSLHGELSIWVGSREYWESTA